MMTHTDDSQLARSSVVAPFRHAFQEARGQVANLRTRARRAFTSAPAPTAAPPSYATTTTPSADGGFTIAATGLPPARAMVALPRTVGAIGFAAALPGDTVAGQVIATGLSSTLSLYTTALTVRILLTWFPNPPQVIAGPLSTICDPYLNLFRGIIPPIGGTIDLSPILAFVVLNVFSGSAASLGAEMPAGEHKVFRAGARAVDQRAQ